MQQHKDAKPLTKQRTKIVDPPLEAATKAPPQIPITPRERFHEPHLPPIRRLQIGALFLALLWLVCALIISKDLIHSFTTSEIQLEQTKIQSHANFIAQLVDKDLHTAEQLALAVSHETDTLKLLSEVNMQAESLAKLNRFERQRLLEKNPLTVKVTRLFDRLSVNVDLTSIFLLDANGNCVSSSHLVLRGEIIKRGCLGSNYQNRHYFQQAKQQGQGRQFAVGKRVPIPSLFFSTAAKSNGEFLGATVTRLNSDSLLDNLREMQTTSWLVDRQGMVISSTNSELLFHHLGDKLARRPSSRELRDTYSLEELQTIPMKPSRDYPSEWHVWELNGKPMVFATAKVEGRDFQVWHGSDIDHALDALDQGWVLATTVIITGLLLILVIERVSDYHHRRRASLSALADANKVLESVSSQLYSIAITDHLTQISSRGYFMQRLEEEVARAKREKHPISLLLLDIDHFKQINDNYGHPAGDAAIRQIAQLCKSCIRGADLVGRMGGEEFAIGLIDGDKTTALAIAEKLRTVCANTPLVTDGVEIHFQCSIGVTQLRPNQTPDDLLGKSDIALYQAKNGGRNCVRYYQ